jgi:hypothetical protein
MGFIYGPNGNLQNFHKTGKGRQIKNRLKKPNLNDFSK